jgi:predicted enzyme related to lactoylglutathione lyase
MFILYVRDMSRAIAFYRDALGMVPRMEMPGWSMLACGGATVALHILGPGVAEGLCRHAGLNLQVDDLDAATEDVVRAGGQLVTKRPAGGGVPVRLAELKDPDGNAFELRQFVGSGPDMSAH